MTAVGASLSLDAPPSFELGLKVIPRAGSHAAPAGLEWRRAQASALEAQPTLSSDEALGRLEEIKQQLVEELYRLEDLLGQRRELVASRREEMDARIERLVILLCLTTAPTLAGHVAHAAMIRTGIAEVELALASLADPTAAAVIAAADAIRRKAHAVEVELGAIATHLDDRPEAPRPTGVGETEIARDPAQRDQPRVGVVTGRVHDGSEAGAFWAELGAELDRWGQAGRRATLFWRDDDASALTAALSRLVALAAESGVPLGLAVIPALFSAELSRKWMPPNVRVLQHGFAHVNHAGAGRREASELGLHRPLGQVVSELVEGKRRLEDGFGARFTPALAPPWNKLAAEVMAALPCLGFAGISAAGERAAPEPVPRLRQANIHWDLIHWRRGAMFRGYASAMALVEHLRRRRSGEAEPDEPTGILSHHLAMDEDAWHFLARFLAVTSSHPAASWCDPAALFPVSSWR